MIRVMRVIARANVGGPALQVSVLMTGLDPDRFTSRLLVGSVDATEADYFDLRAPDVPRTQVPGLGRTVRPTDDARAFRAIVREIDRFKPHIVHTHTAKAGVLGRIAARWCRVPATVHTFHGHLLRGYFSPAKTRAIVLTERALAPSTTRIATVGSRVRDDLLAAGIGQPEQYVVVPPGITTEPAPARAAARARLDLDDDARVVAFVARLTAIKRPDRFAEIAHVVARDVKDAVFIVAGEGDLLGELRAQCADLGDRVRFLGWRGDVETIYAAADVVALTSDNEGMPVSLIECAMYGCPAVTTDVGSAREVVVDGVTGFVCERDVDALAVPIKRLLDDSILASRLGEAARARAQEMFSASRLIADTERVYREIAATKGFA